MKLVTVCQRVQGGKQDRKSKIGRYVNPHNTWQGQGAERIRNLQTIFVSYYLEKGYNRV